MSALKHEIAPDEPTLYIPGSMFVGRGVSPSGTYYEGFLILDDDVVHYYNIADGKEIHL